MDFNEKLENIGLSEKFSSTDLEELKKRISLVNKIHYKINLTPLNERSVSDCAALAIELYNSHLKTISAWNKIFIPKEFQIDFWLSHSFSELVFTENTIEQIADEKAMVCYHELLKL